MQSMASQRVGHNWVTEQQQQINYTSIEKKKKNRIQGVTCSWKEEILVSELEVKKVQNLFFVSERQVEANNTGPRSYRICGGLWMSCRL